MLWCFGSGWRVILLNFLQNDFKLLHRHKPETSLGKTRNMSGKYAFITLRTDGCNHKNRSKISSMPWGYGVSHCFPMVFMFSHLEPPSTRRSLPMSWTWPWCRGSPGHRSWTHLRRWPTLQAEIFLRDFNLEDDGRWYELPCNICNVSCRFFETQIDMKIWAVATLFSVHVS